ncbi:SMI1/KNR4 family protein [Gorillibacterium sp. CAU 1737]|uniref:SMI1/KNR4 family protein n=1 Tax=Gorillibacterium sp. CAU 1737 TaxID=3140362 RepID=UPI0032604FD8
MTTIAQQLWQRIVEKGSAEHPDFREKLNVQPGATKEELEELEKHLGVELPGELKDFYTVHNGQEWDLGSTCFLRNLTLSPIQQVMEDWEFLNEEFEPDDMEVEKIAPQVKPLLWNPKWIPIAGNGGGDHLCIDTDPTESGRFGQVLMFYHDWGYRVPEASGLFEFVELCLKEED